MNCLKFKLKLKVSPVPPIHRAEENQRQEKMDGEETTESQHPRGQPQTHHTKAHASVLGEGL